MAGITWKLRLKFGLWLACVKLVASLMFTWPMLLHTDSILSSREELVLHGSYLRDPLSVGCAVIAGLAWLTSLAAVTGVVRNDVAFLASSRLLWMLLVWITLAASFGVGAIDFALGRRTAPSDEYNTSIFDHQLYFGLCIAAPCLFCLLGSVCSTVLTDLQTVYKAQEIVEQFSTSQ